MLVQYRFTDIRLAYNEKSPNRSIIVGEETLRKKIWIPHVILNNEKEAQIMGLEGKDMFVTITPTGDVTFSYRMTSTIYCWMNLKKFPFDTQTCEIMFRSCKLFSFRLSCEFERYFFRDIQCITIAINMGEQPSC